MTNDELDELERYVNSCREQKEFNEVSLTKRTALRIIALARIGVAAVKETVTLCGQEKSQKLISAYLAARYAELVAAERERDELRKQLAEASDAEKTLIRWLRESIHGITRHGPDTDVWAAMREIESICQQPEAMERAVNDDSH